MRAATFVLAVMFLLLQATSFATLLHSPVSTKWLDNSYLLFQDLQTQQYKCATQSCHWDVGRSLRYVWVGSRGFPQGSHRANDRKLCWWTFPRLLFRSSVHITNYLMPPVGLQSAYNFKSNYQLCENNVFWLNINVLYGKKDNLNKVSLMIFQKSNLVSGGYWLEINPQQVKSYRLNLLNVCQKKGDKKKDSDSKIFINLNLTLIYREAGMHHFSCAKSFLTRGKCIVFTQLSNPLWCQSWV